MTGKSSLARFLLGLALIAASLAYLSRTPRAPRLSFAVTTPHLSFAVTL